MASPQKVSQPNDPQKSNLSKSAQDLSTEQMQSLFNFISGLAQEVSAPLQTIHAHTSRLVKEYSDREFEYISFKEFQDIMLTVDKVNDQVNYCCETVDRIIDLNKSKVKLTKNSCDANEIITETVKSIKPQFEVVGAKIRLRLAKDLPKVKMGSIELNQVVSNVAMNALQAMPAGGVLKIKSSYSEKDKKACITFEDEGVGIAEENIPQVFDPFFTTKERGLDKSSGLGLSIVYSIVKSVKGDVQVESSLRKGTIVTVVLPASVRSKRTKSK